MPMCAVPPCQNESRPSPRITCSPECSKTWRTKWRYRVHSETHARQQAETVLRSPDKYGEIRVRWARKVLGESDE